MFQGVTYITYTHVRLFFLYESVCPENVKSGMQFDKTLAQFFLYCYTIYNVNSKHTVVQSEHIHSTKQSLINEQKLKTVDFKTLNVYSIYDVCIPYDIPFQCLNRYLHYLHTVLQFINDLTVLQNHQWVYYNTAKFPKMKNLNFKAYKYFVPQYLFIKLLNH